MNSKTNYLLILFLVISLAGNVLFYFKIGALENEIEKISQNENQPITTAKDTAKNEDADITYKENTTLWEEYTNSQLGFSIKFPQLVSETNGCSNKPIWVPVKIFDNNENGMVFIIEEYYYDNWDGESQTKTGPCKKTVYSLELLQESPVSGWRILIEDIKNESELNKFIKDNYGPGCFAGKKELWKQNGVYKIEVDGEDWNRPETNLGTTTCPWSYNYKILYAPEKNKIMSVNLGQECAFGTDPSSNFKCYDDEIIDSFRFE